MSFLAAKRVQKELSEVVKSEEAAQSSIKVELFNQTWKELRGEITGPHDTPYEGGRFKLEITIPDNYPFVPPKVRFITKVWHPNISSVTGAICLDILKDQWAASLTLRTMLLSLQALLSAPEPDDPQDYVVAKQYLEDAAMFGRTARYWTSCYAGGPDRNVEYESMVERIVDMGVEEHKARVALSTYSWNLDAAIENIFS